MPRFAQPKLLLKAIELSRVGHPARHDNSKVGSKCVAPHVFSPLPKQVFHAIDYVVKARKANSSNRVHHHRTCTAERW